MKYQTIQIQNFNIPKLNFELLNLLLEKIIFKNKTLEQEIFKEEIKNIKKELVDLECIDEDNNINLKYNKQVSSLLTKNFEKLNSICEIINFEKQSLKEKLKLVVVTDYIKDEYYDIQNEDDIKELGVIPIFRKVMSKCPNEKIAVLTGTFIAIPIALQDKLFEIAEKEYNIPKESITIKELGINFDYASVNFESKYDRFRVNLLTKLFEETDISVLIGTIALIGEGWDAPFVNSLIMATYVASFVTSNQLRGRAIRLNKKDNQKFANIWHLVCLEKENENYVLGYDYEILERRFNAFEGIDIENQTISPGINRLNIKHKYYSNEDVKNLNNNIIEKSRNRTHNTEVWKKALETYTPITTDKITIPRNTIPIKEYNPRKEFLKTHTIKAILYFITCLFFCLPILTVFSPLSFLLFILGCLSIISSIFGLKYLFYFKLKSSYKYFLKSVCKAVYKSLRDKKILSRKTKYFIRNIDGKMEYGLKNGSTYEQMMFLKTIKEAFELTTDSRYIVEFADRACTVPIQFDKNKQAATKFQKLIGSKYSRLTYTKFDAGKQLLLQYKLQLLGKNNNKENLFNNDTKNK